MYKYILYICSQAESGAKKAPSKSFSMSSIPTSSPEPPVEEEEEEEKEKEKEGEGEAAITEDSPAGQTDGH